MSEKPFIAGEKCDLYPLLESHLTYIVEWTRDPDVQRYRTHRVRPVTLEDERAWYQEKEQHGDNLLLCICSGGTGIMSGMPIGTIALDPIDWVHQHAELSILIGRPTYWGKGIGKEAVQLLTAHAFCHMGLRRVWAESANPAFCRLVERLGWKHEGTKREALLVDGEWESVECYGLLKSDTR